MLINGLLTNKKILFSARPAGRGAGAQDAGARQLRVCLGTGCPLVFAECLVPQRQELDRPAAGTGVINRHPTRLAVISLGLRWISGYAAYQRIHSSMTSCESRIPSSSIRPTPTVEFQAGGLSASLAGAAKAARASILSRRIGLDAAIKKIAVCAMKSCARAVFDS